jgi:hypothetical protein
MSKYENIMRCRENPELSAVGSKWTHEEEVKLIKLLREGKNVYEIAKEHKRKPGGIEARIKQIAVRMIEINGKPHDELNKLINMTTQNIEEIQQVHVDKKDTKDTKDETDDTIIDILKDIRKLLIRIQAKLYE